jgi:ABC-2 type transport system ATP-binding protein
VIAVEGLTKRYGRTTAVDDLTFTVQPGRVTGFLGPNGAGKSTTMRLVLGLDHPTAGRTTICGRLYRELTHPIREVGALLDAGQLHPNRSACDHLRWMAAAAGIARSRVDEVLGMVGLTEVAGRKAGGFSLGMKQRLGIATALLGDPPVLLFDEPVNGLDPEGIVWVRELLRYLAGQGRTVFVSSHLLAEMSQTADHLVIIGRGRLIADTPTQDFLANAPRQAVRVRSPQAEVLLAALGRAGAQVQHEADGALTVTGLEAPAIGQLAADHGVVLHELTTLQASLEEAFIALTSANSEFAATPVQGAS